MRGKSNALLLNLFFEILAAYEWWPLVRVAAREGGRVGMPPLHRYYYGPRPLKLTGRHGHILNSDRDIGSYNIVPWNIGIS